MRREVDALDLVDGGWDCEACGHQFQVGELAFGRSVGGGVQGSWRCEPCESIGRPIIERGLVARTRVDALVRFGKANPTAAYVVKARPAP